MNEPIKLAGPDCGQCAVKGCGAPTEFLVPYVISGWADTIGHKRRCRRHAELYAEAHGLMLPEPTGDRHE